jgi:hypothetical protein
VPLANHNRITQATRMNVAKQPADDSHRQKKRETSSIGS